MAKLWRETVGERGLRVVLFERTPGGSLYREVWRGRTRLASKKCLGHRDREKAKVDAYTLLASLKSRDDVQRGAPLTLQLLFDNYEASPAFNTKAPRTRVDDRRKLERVVTFLGADRKAVSLSDSDVEAYAMARRRGEVTGRKCRNRAIEADLSCLRAMLNWGVRQRHRDGAPLLPYNPLQGVRLPKEKNPRRPVATWERFNATRTAMQAQQRSAKTETNRLRWVKLELALSITEATGRRLGSIRQLRWEDISLGKRPMIHWREDTDKQGCEATMPIGDGLRDELRRFRRELGAVAGWVFASPAKPDQPLNRHWFEKGLRQAESLAGLEPLKGGLWHPYRRKWGTERKHLPVTDVALAGGWKDTSTLLTCYTQPDDATLLKVLNEPRKVHESGVM